MCQECVGTIVLPFLPHLVNGLLQNVLDFVSSVFQLDHFFGMIWSCNIMFCPMLRQVLPEGLVER